MKTINTATVEHEGHMYQVGLAAVKKKHPECFDLILDDRSEPVEVLMLGPSELDAIIQQDLALRTRKSRRVSH